MPDPFAANDFNLFTPDKVKDADWDGARLVLKRKLKKWGDAAQIRIKEKHNLELKVQTSLHRPYKFNKYRVDSQRVLLTPTTKQKAGLKKMLGDPFRADVASGVIQMNLGLTIGRREVETALRVHPGAWWDGMAWEKAFAAEPEEISRLLQGLPEEFTLEIHGKERQWDCGEMVPARLGQALGKYRPAEHWIAVKRVYPREAMIEGSEDQEFLLLDDFEALAPVYLLLKKYTMVL